MYVGTVEGTTLCMFFINLAENASVRKFVICFFEVSRGQILSMT